MINYFHWVLFKFNDLIDNHLEVQSSLYPDFIHFHEICEVQSIWCEILGLDNDILYVFHSSTGISKNSQIIFQSDLNFVAIYSYSGLSTKSVI